MGNFDPATGAGGPLGCIFDSRVQTFKGNNGLQTIISELKAFVAVSFPKVHFPPGDLISLAGKCAIEAAIPCLQIQWEYGRPTCNVSTEVEKLPSHMISTLSEMTPFLTRYSLSIEEMAVLTVGAHGIANAANIASESGVASFKFAAITSGVDFILKNLNLQFVFFGDWFETVKSPFFGRFPSDMLFYPRRLAAHRIPADTRLNNVELYLQNFTTAPNSTFDSEFGRVFAKMLRIGTSGLTAFEAAHYKCNLGSTPTAALPSPSASKVSQSTSLQFPTFVGHSPTLSPVMPTSTSAQVFFCKLAWLIEHRSTNWQQL